MTEPQRLGDKRTATIRIPTIEAAVAENYNLLNKEEILQKLESIRANFRTSAQILPSEEGGVVLWIRGYGNPDEAKGFLGHFCELFPGRNSLGNWTMKNKLVEVSLAKHPQRGVMYSPSGRRNIQPNWGHSIFRGHVYDSYKDAKGKLEELQIQFPEVTIPGESHLRTLVYDGSIVGQNKTKQLILTIDETIDGKFKITYRENTSKPRKKINKSDNFNMHSQYILDHVVGYLCIDVTGLYGSNVLVKECCVPEAPHSVFMSSARKHAKEIINRVQSDREELEENMEPSAKNYRMVSTLLLSSLYAILASSFERKEGEKIYHFTDSHGLYGILESGILRLHDVSDMNDPADLYFGISKICEELGTSVEGIGDQSISDLFSAVTTNSLNSTGATRYVFFNSFAEDCDVLELWREYGDAGEGYAFMLDRAELLKHAPVGTLLVKVAYHAVRIAEILTILRNTLTFCAPFVNSAEMSKGHDSGTYDLIVKFVWAIASMIKHRAYRNEKEWRMLRLIHSKSDHQDIKIIPKAKRLKAIINGSAINNSSLDTIIVGNAHEEFEEERVYSLLISNNIDNCKAVRSDVPVKSRKRT